MNRSIFDSITRRAGTDSVKWSMGEDVIPLWVADMDFPTAPCVRKAIEERVSHGVFGYGEPGDEYFDATINWFRSRHGWEISRDAIIPIAGLVPGASVAVKALTQPGDEVIMNTPAYNCFFSTVRNTGCRISENKLICKDGVCTFDFEDFEKRCETAKVFLFCNPHNPSGRLWTREELCRIWEICERHGVSVIADEIHCEIVPPGSSYIPFATISEEARMNCISLVSPTKGFNIAGLHISNMVSENEEFRRRMDRVINDWEHCDVNVIGLAALPAAYSSEGAEWLDAMNVYVHDNYLYARERLEKELPMLKACPLEATYLMWVDCSSLAIDTQTLCSRLKEEWKVWVNSGAMYGDERFVRINIACPRALLVQGMDRLIEGIKAIGICR